MTYDAAGVGIRSGDLRRYPHTVDGDVAGTTDGTANESGGMHAAADSARYVQVLNGGIFDITEKGTTLIVTSPDINIQRMTISGEGATIRRILPYSYAINGRDVGL